MQLQKISACYVAFTTSGHCLESSFCRFKSSTAALVYVQFTTKPNLFITKPIRSLRHCPSMVAGLVLMSSTQLSLFSF